MDDIDPREYEAYLHRVHPEASHMVTSEDKFSGILPYMLKRAGKILVSKKK